MIGSVLKVYSSYRDVAKYYLPYNDHFEVWYLYINMDKWNEMSKKQQEVLQTAANHLEDERWKKRRPRQKNMNRSWKIMVFRSLILQMKS